jgi:hypothetical protein
MLLRLSRLRGCVRHVGAAAALCAQQPAPPCGVHTRWLRAAASRGAASAAAAPRRFASDAAAALAAAALSPLAGAEPPGVTADAALYAPPPVDAATAALLQQLLASTSTCLSEDEAAVMIAVMRRFSVSTWCVSSPPQCAAGRSRQRVCLTTSLCVCLLLRLASLPSCARKSRKPCVGAATATPSLQGG